MASCTYNVPTNEQMNTSGDNLYANQMNRGKRFRLGLGRL